MLFKSELIQAMREGRKTQTRRVKQDTQWANITDCPAEKIPTIWETVTWGWWQEKPMQRHRTKWQVGRRYAIQPGRGKKAVGSFECVGLREERLKDITFYDTYFEGCDYGRTDQFRDLWDNLHKKGEQWADNPAVWVIEMGKFEWEGE